MVGLKFPRSLSQDTSDFRLATSVLRELQGGFIPCRSESDAVSRFSCVLVADEMSDTLSEHRLACCRPLSTVLDMSIALLLMYV